MTVDDPDMTMRCLDELKEISVLFGQAQIDAGADALTFPDHATGDLMPYIAQTGMAAFHFDSKNDPQAAMDAVDGGIRLVGNINNPETLYARGPAEVREEVRKCLDAGVQLVAPECAIPLATKLENLLEIPRAVKEWHGERD
ncbi:hypothetical protein GBAR_LOCUS19144 [Geodia barretti]|uniref:Uroporphyrinogen decarboxylase (URO-D) domain-containing protein n=1 Tax=Geodia barretti TaxID=519541 RepID=A0AA35SQS5_GEOBA|nr:hypothetical protein GBAR_LOCUS19144 [Geodia barretti]